MWRRLTALAAVVAACVSPHIAEAAPEVTWSPSSISQTLEIGKRTTFSASFTVSERVDFLDVEVSVVPALQGFVTVTPTAIGVVQGGEVRTLEITVTAPLGIAPGIYDGTIKLRDATGATSSTSAKPLLAILEFIPDVTPPLVTVTSPSDGSLFNTSPITVTGTLDDPEFSTVAVNGVVATISADGSWTAQIPLAEGSNTITAVATDQVGNQGSASVQVTLDTIAPVVTITSPADFSTVNSSPITVSGTLDDPSASLTVNGAAAIVAADGTWSASVVINEGAITVTAAATDQAGNEGGASIQVTLDTIAPVLAITSPANPSAVNSSPITVSGTLDDPLASLTVNGAPVTVIGGSWTTSLSLIDGANVIIAEAVDPAGNIAAASAVVSLDTVTPTVVITRPADLSTVTVNPVTVEGTVNETGASVTVNGVSATVSAGTWSALVSLVEGNNVITAVATDAAGNQSSAASVQVTLDSVPPLVTITTPDNLSAFNAGPVTVTGTVDSTAVTFTVNGQAIAVTAGVWSTTIPLEREGLNLITAAAQDARGNIGTATIQVALDTRPPVVTIDFPPDGFVTDEVAISVAGMLNDIVAGTVSGDTALVTVNGVVATLDNRAYLAAAVPLQPGPNVITALGEDAAGNGASATITVTRENFTGLPRIALVSGDNQRSTVGTALAAPLVVALTNVAGTPVVGGTVIFKVLEGNGTLTDGVRSGVRSVAVPTDALGLAVADWTLGTRAGPGNNVIEAMAVGFEGTVFLTATGLPAPAAKINVDTGNNQTGVAGEPLPQPFVAIVTDAGHNRLAGVPVTFTEVAGGGSFNGLPLVTVDTDASGRAVALLTLGLQEGIENNVVEATYLGNTGALASFVASGKVAGDPAATVVSGVILDNTNEPIEGVTVTIEGTTLTTQSDIEGQFRILGAPVGHILLLADGGTALRLGDWPSLEFELFTIAGQDNTIGMPIFLLPLDLPNALFVDETTGGALTLPAMPGFSLTVEPGAAAFPDGTRSGLISVTVVHADKVPMTPNFGQQPRFIVTIQPAGVIFDPPAAITLPNTDGLVPGQVTELYSFDHDLAAFVSIGTGTVSNDGTIVASDNGVGVIKAGWHCGGDPSTSGSCCNCAECQECKANACVPVAVELTITQPPDNPDPSDAGRGDNFSFLARRSFANTATQDEIFAKATVTPAKVGADILWSVMATLGGVSAEKPSSKKGTDFSFVPDPPAHPGYLPGTGCGNPEGGSCGRSDALSYTIKAEVCSTSDTVTITQDQIDIIIQEYANHGITIPNRVDFVLPQASPNGTFSVFEVLTPRTQAGFDPRLAYDFIIGNPAALAELIRNQYNTRIFDDVQLQPVNTDGLDPMAMVVAPGANVETIGHPILNTPPCYPNPDPQSCDDHVLVIDGGAAGLHAGPIVAGPNGMAETQANNNNEQPTNFGLNLNSAWRHPERNEAVGSKVKASRHQYGDAIDLAIPALIGVLTFTELYCILEAAGDAVVGAADSFTENPGKVPCTTNTRITHLHAEKD